MVRVNPWDLGGEQAAASWPRANDGAKPDRAGRRPGVPGKVGIAPAAPGRHFLAGQGPPRQYLAESGQCVPDLPVSADRAENYAELIDVGHHCHGVAFGSAARLWFASVIEPGEAGYR